MRALLFFLLTLFLNASCTDLKTRRPEVYDCFLFFNELELLTIRLNELYEHVDHFVLVEADETFSGLPKQMYFAENRERFAPFLDKIIYVPLHDKAKRANTAWDREHFQRNQIVRGLKQCRDVDLVMISDLDEIPRGERLQELLGPVARGETPALFARMTMYRGFLNRFDVANTPWSATAVTTYGALKKGNADSLRGCKDSGKYPVVENMGWHFTSMGGTAMVVQKFESWSHTENNTPEYKNPDRIRAETSGQWLVEIDETYPCYIREHKEELLAKGYLDTVLAAPNRDEGGAWRSNVLLGYVPEQRNDYCHLLHSLVERGYLLPYIQQFLPPKID